MNVIGHETIHPIINFITPARIGHQGDIFSIIIVAEKSLHAAVSPLREMMRYARYDDPRYPCHERNVANTFRKCQKLRILSPELPELPNRTVPISYSRTIPALTPKRVWII